MISLIELAPTLGEICRSGFGPPESVHWLDSVDLDSGATGAKEIGMAGAYSWASRTPLVVGKINLPGRRSRLSGEVCRGVLFQEGG